MSYLSSPPPGTEPGHEVSGFNAPPGVKTGSAVRYYFAALLVLICVVVSAFWKTTSPHLFFYDEADYMYAGTRGFVNNYLDRPSLSTLEFIRKGRELAHDKSQRSNMSQYVRSSGDVTFYRHYHGPVYAYWIALAQALGVHDEENYRATGLVLHALATVLIFWCFRRAFPEYPPAAALAAALTFLLNRTALVSSTSITQHVMFGLTASLTLFPLALFCRTGERRFWYWTAIALGVSFSTVETSFVLVGAVLCVLCMVGWRTGWRNLLTLFGRGVLIFLLTILVIWPKGILSLGMLKGYIYLGYIALVKKTFTPMSPFALWGFKISVYPEEFVVPAIALIAATIAWRRLAAGKAIWPYLVYTWMFLGVTMIITAPYTYYHDSLLLSGAVVTGVMFGEIWRRNMAWRVVASAILMTSLLWMSTRYYGETVAVKEAVDHRPELLSYIQPVSGSRTLYVPYVLVPTLHFYRPELTAIGYDAAWSPSDLATALSAGGPNAEFFCEQSLCEAVMTQLRNTRVVQVMGADKDLNQGTLYSVAVDPGLPVSR